MYVQGSMRGDIVNISVAAGKTNVWDIFVIFGIPHTEDNCLLRKIEIY